MKPRKSNLELLRIAAMMLVLLIHYVPTRNVLSGCVEYDAAVTGGGIALINNALIGNIIDFCLKSLCFVCVNCFVLISGYFGIKFKFRSFANLIFQILFWSVLCIAISRLPFLHSNESFGKTIISGFYWGWFPRAYVILFVISPLLESFCRTCPEQQLGKYILVFYLLSTVGGYFMLWSDFNEGMSALSLIGLYLIGAYLKRTKLKIFNLKAKYDLMIYFAGGLALVILSIILLMAGVSVSPYGYMNPVVIIMSVYLFLFFAKIDIGQKVWINSIAASAFAVYLFHVNSMIFPHIRDMWVAINIKYGIFGSLPVAVASFIAIFIICILFDRIRIWSFDKISGIFIKE